MKTSLSSHKPFPILAIAVLATMSVAGCSSGPDIKPPPSAPVPQADAPSAQTAELQTSLAAMDRNLVELWQAQAETQRLAAELGRSCGGGGADTGQKLQLQLQDAMNQQQQAMQILSNLMKNQHDTLKAVIQNLR